MNKVCNKFVGKYLLRIPTDNYMLVWSFKWTRKSIYRFMKKYRKDMDSFSKFGINFIWDLINEIALGFYSF